MGRVVDGGASDLEHALSSGGRILVEFWASWCTQCPPMANVVERLAESLPPDVSVMKIDIGEHERAATTHGIRGLPALVLFEGGQETARIVGFKRLPLVVEELRPHL